MIASIRVWSFSSLRFQAEMGMPTALWLTASVMSTLSLMLALAYIFKPRFMFGELQRRSSNVNNPELIV